MLKREQLTAAWLGQRKQKKKKEKRIHSTQQHSVPNVSRPVAQNNGMEAYHQAAALLGPLISWPVWKKFCQHCTAGWPGIWRWFHRLDSCTKLLYRHSKCIVRGPNARVSKHWNSWQRKYYSGLHGGCILFRQEELSDMAIISAPLLKC